MSEYTRKFLIGMPADLGDGKGYVIRLFRKETAAAILESNGETFGFDVIAEITDNPFYTDYAIGLRGGKLLTLEIEKRWLVKIPDDLERFPYHTIEQSYLPPKNGFRGRIRRLDDKFVYTEKNVEGSGMSRIENECGLTEEEYNELKKKTEMNTIKKRRYVIPFKGLTFELDVFENTEESGYAIMEAELPSESTAVFVPDFVEIVREVTDDPYYTNKNFASMDKIRLLKQ